MLAQRPERFAKRDIEGEDQATHEDRAQDQDAARGSGETPKRLSLGATNRSAGAAGREVKETERCDKQQGDAQAAAPGHRLDPGHEQLGCRDQRREDHKDNAPPIETHQPSAKQVHGGAAGLKRDRQHKQAGEQHEANPGKLALLRLGDLELRKARCLDSKALPRGRALRARDALSPGSHTSRVAATSAVTNGAILAAIQCADQWVRRRIRKPWLSRIKTLSTISIRKASPILTRRRAPRVAHVARSYPKTRTSIPRVNRT